MDLALRDQAVCLYLRTHGVARYQLICDKFYKDRDCARKRLKKLEKLGIIEVKMLSEVCGSTSKLKDVLFECGILKRVDQLKIVRLGQRLRGLVTKIYEKFSDLEYWAHQIIVTEAEHQFSKKFPKAILTAESDLLFQSALAKKPEDYYPDLMIEYQDSPDHQLKIAIEIERTRKPKNRLDSKLRHYRRSAYTHVIYFCGNLKLAQFVLGCGRSDRKLGVGLISDFGKVYRRDGALVSLEGFTSQRLTRFDSSLSIQEMIDRL